MTAPGWTHHAIESTILRGVVGSTAHGLALEGTDDLDEMGVCLPDPKWVVGLDAPQHLVLRDAAEGERSMPGDLDLTIYSLRRYIHLLVRKANPTCQILLWLPESMLTAKTRLGVELRELRAGAVCQALGRSFLGYMRHQRERMTGERGQKRTKRPELVEAHGFDTKYAGHVIRLGYQGIEMAADGCLTLPMKQEERDRIMAIRRGEISERDVLGLASDLEATLAALVPEMEPEPSPELEEWMIEAHLDRWSSDLQKEVQRLSEREDELKDQVDDFIRQENRRGFD